MDELHARLALSNAAQPGDAHVGAAVLSVGAIEVVEALESGKGSALRLDALQECWPTVNAHAAADTEWNSAQMLGVRFLCPGDPGWPTQLDGLGARAPIALRTFGAVELRSAAIRSVAMVGARSASRYGVAVADQIAADLAGRGWVVVSGAAFGIDAASHAGAMAVGGLTVAVTAAGVERATPASNAALYSRIYERGVVVSETPIGSTPNKSRFIVRNRLIAALARAVVVVEAGHRSGALATAREGSALGRVIAAVPGPVTSAVSAGCHDLIRDARAVLVTSAEDVLQLLVPPGLPAGTKPRLAKTDQLVLNLVSGVPASVDGIASGVDASASEVVSSLLGLEQFGLVQRDSSGWSRVVTDGREAG